MSTHNPVRFLLIALVLLIAGCGISKPFPEKGLYAIDAGPPDHGPPSTQPTPAATPIILQVPQMRIATPYDGNSFIYRVGPQKYASDYYNGFVASPASLMTGALISCLGRAGLYSSVVDGNSSVDYNLVLEGNISELCGDYTQPKSPQGVIVIRFFVLRHSGDGVQVLHDKVYRAAQPAGSDKPEALVKAWGLAYRRIIEDLVSDLRSIDTSPAARVSAR
jgi:ABC-type uncharacterized transport system auxiliary subunit